MGSRKITEDKFETLKISLRTPLISFYSFIAQWSSLTVLQGSKNDHSISYRRKFTSLLKSLELKEQRFPRTSFLDCFGIGRWESSYPHRWWSDLVHFFRFLKTPNTKKYSSFRKKNELVFYMSWYTVSYKNYFSSFYEIIYWQPMEKDLMKLLVLSFFSNF